MMIEVADLDRAARFYETLGMTRIVWSPPRYARLEARSGATTLSLEAALRPATGGVSLYFETDDLDARCAALAAAGIAFDGPPTAQDWRWREAWTRDPDGRRVCLFHAGPDRRFPPWRVTA